MSVGEAEQSHVSTLSQVGTVTKYNFLNYFRARRFYVMLAIIVIISVLITALVAYFRPVTFLGIPGEDPALAALGFYGAGWGSFATIIVILSAILFGGDAISGEFQNKTGYFLVPNPVRRSAIYTGKWIAALVASTIILSIFALTILANGLYYFPGQVPWQFEQSFAFAWLYMVAALSLTFAFSSLFKTSTISILMSFIVLFLVFNILDTVLPSVAGVEPWFSITYGAGIVASILQSPYPNHMLTEPIREVFGGGGGGNATARFTITIYNSTVVEGLVILITYFLVMAVLGLILFERKEFTS